MIRSYLYFGILAVIVLALAVGGYIFYQKLHPAGIAPGNGQFSLGNGSNSELPVVSFTLNKTKDGNVLIVAWRHLPNGTNVLTFWKAPKGSAAWAVFENVKIAPGTEDAGTVSINVGNLDTSKYDFSVQAVHSEIDTTGVTTQEALWTSPVIAQTTTASGTVEFGYVSSSTPDLPPVTSSSTTTTATTTATTSAPPQTSSSGNSTTTAATATTTQSVATTTAAATTTTSTTTATTTAVPTYYTYSPQLQPQAQSAPDRGNFWVDYLDGSIEIGWQNLPSSTNKVIVSRSQSQSGPWTAILTQQNPDIVGPYSIKIVDDAYGVPHYYKLDALHDSLIIQTYGPIYLSAQ